MNSNSNKRKSDAKAVVEWLKKQFNTKEPGLQYDFLNKQQLETMYQQWEDLPLDKIPELIEQLEIKMQDAAKNLEFEEAAKYRDQIKHLRDRLLGHPLDFLQK